MIRLQLNWEIYCNQIMCKHCVQLSGYIRLLKYRLVFFLLKL